MWTFWKAYQVYFPMQHIPPHLEVTIKSYAQISQDCSKVNSLSWQNVGTTSHAKLYQSTMFCDACCTWMESLVSLLSHQQTARHFDFPLGSYNSFSGDCSGNWQPREDPWKSISWKPFHILYLFISISCSDLPRRVVPSINIPMLLSNKSLLIIKIQNPFCLAVC